MLPVSANALLTGAGLGVRGQVGVLLSVKNISAKVKKLKGSFVLKEGMYWCSVKKKKKEKRRKEKL